MAAGAPASRGTARQDSSESMDRTIAAALVDRLMHHAPVRVTDGDSIRLADAMAGKGGDAPRLMVTLPGERSWPSPRSEVAVRGEFSWPSLGRSSCPWTTVAGAKVRSSDTLHGRCRTGEDRPGENPRPQRARTLRSC